MVGVVVEGEGMMVGVEEEGLPAEVEIEIRLDRFEIG